mgnify:CR=1 FL=1
MAKDLELITVMLNDIKRVNDENKESIDRLFSCLAEKILSSGGKSIPVELLKAYLEDLTKTVGNKFFVTLDKFTAVEGVLKNIFDGHDGYEVNEAFKQLMGALSANLNSFRSRIEEQNEIFSDIQKYGASLNETLDKDQVADIVTLIQRDVDTINKIYRVAISSVSRSLNSIISSLLLQDNIVSEPKFQNCVEVIYDSIYQVSNLVNSVDLREDSLEQILNYTVNSENLKNSKSGYMKHNCFLSYPDIFV